MLLITLLITIVSSFSTDWTDEFDYYTYLDADELFRVYWNNLENDIIEFGIEASATGWISIGISPNGQMPGSDVAIGWVDDDGNTYLQDRYTEGRVTPLYESHQNLTLISGEETDGMTRIRFMRPKYTCNENDIQVSDGTTRLIWAFHSTEDPSSECFDSSSISMHTNKGSQSLNLNTGIQTPIELEDDIEFIDIHMDEVSVPNEDTTYYCKIFKLPELDSTHHVIKFEPIVEEGNEGAVHHYIVYECGEDIITDDAIGAEGVCATDFENMPAKECRSSSLLWGWAIGGGALYLPQNVGLPIGGDSGPKYIMFEVHYDNPTLRDDIIDSSGFRMTITPTLRTHNAGYMTAATFINQLGTFIPPGLSYGHNRAFMDGSCTKDLIPDDGIKILTSNLHMHTLGVAGSLRIIRDGVELEPIESNWNYDFNYQNSVYHEDGRIIYAGDTLIMDCYYDSSARDYLTIGGESTQEEMCSGTVMYYPSVGFFGGVTAKTELSLYNWLNDAQNAGYVDGNITEAFTEWNFQDNLEFNQDLDGYEEFYSRLWDPSYSSYNRHYSFCGAFVNESAVIFSDNATQPIGFEEYDLNVFTCDDYDSDTDAVDVCIPDGPDLVPATTTMSGDETTTELIEEPGNASMTGNMYVVMMTIIGFMFV